MTRLKIALCNMRHRTIGLRSKEMPLGIGLIAAYANKHLDEQVEIRLYAYYEPFREDLETWKPDVVGASFFSWNRRLTLHLLDQVKQHAPHVPTLLGGPELELEHEKCIQFLETHPAVDICCVGEGEATALEIFQACLNGKDPRRLESLPGTFYRHPDSGQLVVHPRRPRIQSLDEIPSPYTTGLFDPFFKDNLHPFIESHRGCPFSCTFCHLGLDTLSKVTYQSVERTLEDLEYCARRYAGRTDIQLCIGDNNFAMYKKDIPLAHRMRELQEKYGWPRYIIASTGKNKKERMVEVSNILKWGLPFNMAAQSLNPRTMELIGRKNISIDVMRETLLDINHSEADSYTELILTLPEETRETFENGLRKIVATNLNWISIMSLLLLNGTELATRSIIDRYQFDIRYRVTSRQLGEYDDQRIIEMEAVVVGTNTMPYRDYCDLRELTFVIQVIYNSDAFNPIRRFLIELGIDVWDWIKNAHEETLQRGGLAKAQLDAFMAETHGELFASEQELLDYFADDSHYRQLLNGEVGDNLMAKYQVLANSEGFNAWLAVAVQCAHRLAQQTTADQEYLGVVMDALERYITLTYDFAPYFNTPPQADKHVIHKFPFDIQIWIRDRNATIQGCWGEVAYDCYFPVEKVDRIHKLRASSHDLSFTIQRVYRDKHFEELLPNLEREADGPCTSDN